MSCDLKPAAVRVPGSSSNLGAGFDCVGIAVDRWLDIEYEPGPDELRVIRPESRAALLGRDLLEASFRQALEERGRPATGTLHARSDIPIGRGLGSSAAVVVGGTALAGLVCGDTLDAQAAFRRATEEEGHGDNAAPSAFGGLLAVVEVGGEPRPVPLVLSPTLSFAFAAPPTPLATREARQALPTTVPHSAAVGAVARMAALLRGLATGDADLLRLGFHDVALHAPWRRALITGADDAFAAALEAGASGVTVSGAGSGILAVGPQEAMADVADAMAQALRSHHAAGVLSYPLTPVSEGVRVQPVTAST